MEMGDEDRATKQKRGAEGKEEGGEEAQAGQIGERGKRREGGK